MLSLSTGYVGGIKTGAMWVLKSPASDVASNGVGTVLDVSKGATYLNENPIHPPHERGSN